MTEMNLKNLYYSVKNLFWGIKYTLFGTNSFIVNQFNASQIITYYDGDNGHQTKIPDGNLGFGLIHYALIMNHKPKNILCIGSRKGYIPAICALACRDIGCGHVDFVDAGYRPGEKNHWSGIGWWKQINPDKHFSLFEVNRYLTPYIMTTSEFVKLHQLKRYDYIYIDGDHSYQGVRKDYKLLWPKLNSYGFMVFHDVWVRYTKNLGNFGVWKLWKELKSSHKIIFPYPEESGLGIIQKT